MKNFRRFLPVLFILYVVCLYGVTALLQDGLFERDGYYHARLAASMPERGLDRSFPWTQLSTWRDRYCDKEFLYHAAMMPFAYATKDAITGARVFACMLSTLVIIVLWQVLRTHGCLWPVFFAALPFAAGGLFIARLGMIRSHVLSMLLLTVGLHLFLRGKHRGLFALAFVYAWSYTMPFVLLMTAVPFVAGVAIKSHAWDWKLVVAAGLGSAAGLIVHPYFPETMESFLTYLQVFSIGMEGTVQSGFELGNEIYRYDFAVFWNLYPLFVGLVPTLIAAAAWQWQKLTASTSGVLFSAVFWVVMTVASPRFVEYSVLLVTVACAFVVRDLARVEWGLTSYLSSRTSLKRSLVIAAIVLLIGFHIRSMNFYFYYQTESAPPRFFKGATAWMAEHLEPGETVINLFWDDFPELFYDGLRQRYLWGLDPTYSIRYDPEKARLLEDLRRHKRPLEGRLMKEKFQSEYIVLRAGRAWSFLELRLPPFKKVFDDGNAVIYRIR